METRYEEQVLKLNNRENLSVNDCVDIHSFNEDEVLLETRMGLLHIAGEDLRITNLNLDQGEISLTGRIYSLNYKDDIGFDKKGGGLFSKLFN